MKKIFYTMAVAAALFTGYSAYNVQNSNELTDIALANVEALSQSREGLDCNYTREEGKCEVFVGAKGKIKMFNGTIIEAGTSGIISFDGKVVCGRNGRLTCEPIECKTLYTIILDNSKK